MTFDKFTIKAQETVQEAVSQAQKAGQQTIEPVHMLQGLLTKGKDVTTFIFQKLGINPAQIETLVQSEIAHLPKVSGGEPYLSTDTNKVLQRAMEHSEQLGDQFVGLESILLALFMVSSPASRILKDAGCTEQELTKAIKLSLIHI